MGKEAFAIVIYVSPKKKKARECLDVADAWFAHNGIVRNPRPMYCLYEDSNFARNPGAMIVTGVAKKVRG